MVAAPADAASSRLTTFVLASGDVNSAERIGIEARLGARSFRRFFHSAWKSIDPAHLLWNWHIDLMCDTLERVARREVTEIVICVPPRSLKSQIFSVAFPAWVWTWNPSAKFICGSNEMQLALRDADKMRQLVKSDWYQKRWGPGAPHLPILYDGSRHPGVTLRATQDNKGYFENTAGGHRFCCTPGSNVTGHGGDYVMVDDPHPAHKAESEAQRREVLQWWWEAIPTRLNEPDRGAKLVIQQRVHRSDLAGTCLERGYESLVLPMEFEPDHPQRHPRDQRKVKGDLLHPERTNQAALAKLKAALGPYGTAGQLQQRPVPREGGLFRRSWFKVVDAAPAECYHRAVRKWDLAATVPTAGKDPDWTAGAKVALDDMGRIFILDIQRFRLSPAEVDMAIKAVAGQDGSGTRIGIPQDPGQAGVAQAQALSRFLQPYMIEAIRETGSKEDRARGFASQAQMGNVHLVRGKWVEPFLDEITDFPNGAHDDQIDAAVGGWSMLHTGDTGIIDYYRQLAQGVV
jgi:predicted phage terminase large subunit-like protein